MSPEDRQPEPRQPAAGKAKAGAAKPKPAAAKAKAEAAKTKPATAKPPQAKAAGENSSAAKPATSKAKVAAKKPAAKQPAADKASAKPAPDKKPAAATNPKGGRKPAAAKPAAAPDAEPVLPNQPLPVRDGEPRVKASPGQTRPRRASVQPLPAGLWPLIKRKAPVYWRLTRMHKPIGSLLLLWPTLWSLWLAAKGLPSWKNLVIFTLGVLVMRSAGCVINDFADRKVDGHVKRTQDRPLATGEASPREAIGLFICLCLIAFGLVLLTNPLTIQLSLGGLLLAFCYPFMKRYTHLPQLVLGAAFAWGIPMAYAAETNSLPDNVWLVYIANLLWTVVYDTFYAMVDRDDDIKIGVKSTAILFGDQDRLITGLLQGLTLYSFYVMGERFELGGFYWFSLVVAASLFGYQQWLIRYRARQACFAAFINNNWVGAAVFAGIALHFVAN